MSSAAVVTGALRVKKINKEIKVVRDSHNCVTVLYCSYGYTCSCIRLKTLCNYFVVLLLFKSTVNIYGHVGMVS